MGASESSPPASRRQLVRADEPDGFQVLRLQAERQEVRLGGQALETERVQITTVSSSGNRIHCERIQIRASSASTSRVQRGLEWRSPAAIEDDSDSDSNSAGPSDNGKCSYDEDGPGYMLQPWYKCYTCWGSDADESAFGCCSRCASTCHRGHRLTSRTLSNAECDCGQNKHQMAVCTWNVTRRNYVKQPFYRCYDCFTGRNDGVCYQCKRICHSGHNTSYIGVTSAFCDCGMECCRISCSIAKPK